MTVAEALVDLCSFEILSGIGRQFISECMKEVARLLSIKRFTSSPYHPTYNGFTEKFNGTLKTMRRRLCNEQLKLHKPTVLAYREVAQESTGFSQLELVYG